MTDREVLEFIEILERILTVAKKSLLDVLGEADHQNASGGEYGIIGGMLYHAGEENNEGARKFIYEHLCNGAFQAVAQQLKVAPETIIERFGHLYKTPYEQRLIKRVEAFEKEKESRPKVEPKEKGPTIEELRAIVIAQADAMREKWRITDSQLYASFARQVGRPIGKVADLKKSELLEVYEMLENWDADLISEQQDKICSH